jgi:CheY-like chemotaxis protein
LARKILLADDSVTAQNMGRRILSDAGYEVTTVNNGSAALKKIAESKPDLIVLDVYMPGYGGLEVCQRLRESRETARIPILLTVGKLEPFKPEEARRVKADAFIVKPFEASELLTALTKLEDRIVPQPAPYKPGRFAQAMSALETDTTSNEYGDLESGWKNRLKIPVPKSHGPDVEEQEPAEAESRKPEVRRKEEQQPAAAEVPRDITPEEIAAINAAAAAFGTQIAEPATEPQITESAAAVAFEGEPAKEEEVKPENMAAAEDEPPATFATAASLGTQTEPERDTELRGEFLIAEEAVKSEVAETEATAVSEIPPELAASAEAVSTVPTDVPPKVEERDDFAAALESLGPSNGHGSPQHLSGPRWTAELVAITDAESALVLEQEMEKAVAAMAAVNASEAERAPVAVLESSASNTVEAAHQEAVDVSAVEYLVGGGQDAGQEAPTSLMAAMTEAAIAETTINEPARSTLSDLVDSVLPQSSAEGAAPEPQAEAFAAAAAGGSDAVSQSLMPVEVPQAAPAANDPDERQRESELAAAWESWKQIRESVVEPQVKSQVATTPAETPGTQEEQVASPQDEFDGETGGHEDSVASIVDSVLADLKPKLMEEISRKMGKEKKRK